MDYVTPYTQTTFEEAKQVAQQFNIDISDEELHKRFNNESNLFKLSLRSIAYHLPWITNVHIILANESHIPDWLNVDKVNIVYHKDILPKLPCYCSTSIEMYLCNINGLSDRFLYGNSDFVVNNFLLDTEFFDKDIIKHNFHVRASIDSQHDQICYNCHKLFFPESKVFNIPEFHCLSPMVLERVQACYSEYKEEIDKSFSIFRTDNSLSQYIYSLYDLVHNKTEVSNLHNVTVTQHMNIYNMLHSDVVCFNDINDDNKNIRFYLFLNKWAQKKCKYEK